MVDNTGKISNKDLAKARALKLAPWLAILLTTIPPPIIFLILFLMSAATETAAIFFFLAGISLVLGAVAGLVIAAILWLYRKRWLAQLRDRLASDGITASEVVWFRSELTSHERASLDDIQRSNPLLADAYLDTLASRLTASRILSRSKREILNVERRINRARTLGTNDAAVLQKELEEDRAKLDELRQNATEHLSQAKTQLQMIEATASRKLNETETEIMMQRLGAANDTLPLVLEIAKMEQQLLSDATPKKQQSLPD